MVRRRSMLAAVALFTRIVGLAQLSIDRHAPGVGHLFQTHMKK